MTLQPESIIIGFIIGMLALMVFMLVLMYVFDRFDRVQRLRRMNRDIDRCYNDEKYRADMYRFYGFKHVTDNFDDYNNDVESLEQEIDGDRHV